MLHFDIQKQGYAEAVGINSGSASSPASGSTFDIDRPTELAVIVPVMNEHANVRELLHRLSAVLPDIVWEAIFVDDASTDGTPELLEEIARSDRRVRLIRRFSRRGLSSAVIEGMLSSVAPVVAVIDGDLQHDEAILPDLYRMVAETDCEIAIGSRYMLGGSTSDWPLQRQIVSKLATRLSRYVTRATVSDPMSGFFAVSRSRVVELAPSLSGVGYKILLDLLTSAKTPLAIAELPYVFRTRTAGESKLDGLVIGQYLEMLWEKQFGNLVPTRFVKFALVGLSGLVVHMNVLGLALTAGAGFGLAQSLAVAVAIAFNFFLNNAFTYRDRRLTGAPLVKGLASFYVICSIGAAANVGAGLALFVNQNNWWIAGATGALVGSIWNYTMGTAFTWKRR